MGWFWLCGAAVCLVVVRQLFLRHSSGFSEASRWESELSQQQAQRVAELVKARAERREPDSQEQVLRKESYRKREGHKVRLRDAVTHGELRSENLQRILESSYHSSGEKAKALRVLVTFFHDEQALPVLLEALKAPDIRVHQTALKQLARMGYPAQMEELILASQRGDDGWLASIYRHLNPKQRSLAVERLGLVGSEEGLDFLRGLLEQHPRWSAERRAIDQSIESIEKRIQASQGGALSMADTLDERGGLSVTQLESEGGISLAEEP